MGFTSSVTKRCYVVLRVDGFNPASVAGASVNQGPPQMMGIGMSGRAGAMGPEGTPNMGAPNMMPDNGAMVMYALKWALTLNFFSISQ